MAVMGRGYKNKFKTSFSSNLGACSLLIRTYEINKSKVYESKCVSFLLMFNKLPQAVSQLQFLVAVRLKAPFPQWLPAGDQSQLLEVTCIPCHVAYSIFKASNREFLSHQIPLTLFFLTYIYFFISQFESLSSGRAQFTLRPYLIRSGPPQIIS